MPRTEEHFNEPKLIQHSPEDESFSDTVFGCFMDDLEIQGEVNYICLIERMETGFGKVVLEIGSEFPINLNL